jgi:hypothetical protein
MSGKYQPFPKHLFSSLSAKLNLLKTPLQRIVFGGFLASLSFFVSGGLEMILQV